MWKFLKYGLVAWLGLSIVTLPLYWPYLRMMWVFNARIAPPSYDAPSSPADARRQDVDYLSTLTTYDRSFSEEASAAFAASLGALEPDIETMSDAAFYLSLSEAVALADNGHTNLSYRPQYSDFNAIGARLYTFDDGLFVVGAAADQSSALGQRVISVEGQPVDGVRETLRRYRGGNQTWRDLYTTFILESPELLAGAGIAASAEAITLELEDAAGARETVRFAGRAPTDADDRWRTAWQTLVPGALPGDQDGWVHALDGVPLPRYLSAPDEPLSYALENGGLYIRALAGFSAGDQSIADAYKAMLSGHADGSLDYLVVDFRLHDGGDCTKSMAFAKAAPRAVKPDGAVYIVTGPNTFSAAIVTVAMLKYYSGDRGQIIGEQMGDREQFWAERGSSFQLPNSGYYVNYATGFHDWESGCKGEPFCYTMNEMHEVPAGSLAPSVVLGQSFDSYRRGEDVVLDWVAERH